MSEDAPGPDAGAEQQGTEETPEGKEAPESSPKSSTAAVVAADGATDGLPTAAGADGESVEPARAAGADGTGAEQAAPSGPADDGKTPPEGAIQAQAAAEGAGAAQSPAEGAEGAQPVAEGVDGAQPPAEGGERAQPQAEGAEVAQPPAEGTEGTQPTADGTEAAQSAAGASEAAKPAAEGAEAIQPTAEGAEGAQPPAEDGAEVQEKVPELVKVVHSARSVFRQRDQKEYDPFTAHLERRITKLFEALDTEGTGRVDVHELGTLVRSVGCCPSESELQEMVTQLEEEGQPGLIRLEKVLPYIVQCVEDRKYQSATTEQLLQAFQVLAEEKEGEEAVRGPQRKDKKEEEQEEGTMPQDKLVHILTEEGEHLSQEEVEEMLSVMAASDSGRVDYTEFVKLLVVPELW